MNGGWTCVALGSLGFALPIASTLVFGLASGSNGLRAFVNPLLMGVFNQLPFLVLAFQISREIDPLRRTREGNRSRRKAIIVEFISLVAINAWVSVGIVRDRSDFVGFGIISGLLLAGVAMALGYFVTLFTAEFLNGLLGQEGNSH